MPDDPMAAMRALGNRLKEEAEKLGLTLELFAQIPDLTGEMGGDRVQCIFIINKDQVGKTEDQRKMDEEFEKIAADFARQQEEEKAEQIRNELMERMKNRKGLFDD